jgi:MoaA/NifB/PqqE/SkfB family radical SAM enzyme
MELNDQTMSTQDKTAEDTRCIFAWRGLHIAPNGDVSMCCKQKPIGFLMDDQQDSIKDIRNSNKWNKIRKDMIEGKRPNECWQCWDEEVNGFDSLRKMSNKFHKTSLEEVVEQNDYRLQDDKLSQADIRTTNLCNMKCVSCNPVFSSMWNLESIQHNNTYWSLKNVNTVKSNGVLTQSQADIKTTIMDNIENIDEFYFAGGEPLLDPFHWEIIEKLDELKRYDVKIVYNTNGMKLDYKGKSILDYWDKFKNFTAAVSIDAIGKRAEYVRFGTDWKQLDKNFVQLLERYPDNINVDVTMSALNAGGILELFDYFQEINLKKFRYQNYVLGPSHLHVSQLPKFYRQHLVEQLELYTENCKDSDFKSQIEKGLNEFKYQMLESKLAPGQVPFFNLIERIDSIRKNSIYEACPEYNMFYREKVTVSDDDPRYDTNR